MMSTLLLLPVAALAGGIELTTRAEAEIMQKNEKGENVLKLVEADKANVLPGDTVRYTITYVNKGDQPATDVAIKNPVPEHLVYVDKSAEGAGTRIDFSIDNGSTYGPFASLKVKNKAGRERPARADEITNLKWTVEKPLEPNGQGTVSYRAKVK